MKELKNLKISRKKSQDITKIQTLGKQSECHTSITNSATDAGLLCHVKGMYTAHLFDVHAADNYGDRGQLLH